MKGYNILIMEERLQKYMASCGVASRRKCEELILQGKVQVNDILITELGKKVNLEKDIVKYNGKIIAAEVPNTFTKIITED